MDLSTLKDLLPIMRDCKVTSFKLDGLEIFFQAAPAPREVAAELLKEAAELSKPKSEQAPGVVAAEAPVSSPGVEALKSLQTVRIQDVVVPQGLEEEMNPDKILHWSSPNDDTGSMPLTDDAPIGDPAPVEAPHG